MFSKIDFDTPGALGFEVGSEVTSEDYDRASEEIRQAVDEHGKIRVLFRVPTTPETQMKSADGPIGFVYEHEDVVERIAVVGDDLAVKWLARLGDKKLDPPLQRFDPDDDEAARQWLTEPG